MVGVPPALSLSRSAKWRNEREASWAAAERRKVLGFVRGFGRGESVIRGAGGDADSLLVLFTATLGRSPKQQTPNIVMNVTPNKIYGLKSKYTY
jgi:hypothetical protein